MNTIILLAVTAIVIFTVISITFLIIRNLKDFDKIDKKFWESDKQF